MTRAEWTNTLSNSGTGAITLGVKRDLGVVTDYFPVSDGSYHVKPEGAEVYPQTWYDKYLQRRLTEFCRARLATTYGSAENRRLWDYIDHIYRTKNNRLRRKSERGEKKVWRSYIDGKIYPDKETADRVQKAEAEAQFKRDYPSLYKELHEPQETYAEASARALKRYEEELKRNAENRKKQKE